MLQIRTLALWIQIGMMLISTSHNAQARTGLIGQTLRVNASFYGEGDGFDGKRAANGSIFHKNAPTVAHKTLPFGTQLVLTNPTTGKTARATVTDRGPFVKGRDLDVSAGLAGVLGFKKSGTAHLTMEIASIP
jgi:rare lipoprotein A